MALIDLNKRQEDNITNGKDQVVIRKRLAFIDGGRSLDVTGYTDTAIYAGHIVIRDINTDEYKPLGVEDGAFKKPSDSEVIVGVVTDSILTEKPFASILTAGVVSEQAMPFTLSYEVKALLISAAPGLQVHKD